MQQELQEMVEEFQIVKGDSFLEVMPELKTRGFVPFSFEDLARVINENPASRSYWTYHRTNTADTVINKPFERGQPRKLKLVRNNPVLTEAAPVLQYLFPGDQMFVHPSLYGEFKGTEFVRLMAPDEKSKERSDEFLMPAKWYSPSERYSLEKLYQLGATPLNVPLRYAGVDGRQVHEAKISGFLATLCGFDFDRQPDEEGNRVALTNLHSLVDAVIESASHRNEHAQPEENGVMRVRILEFASRTPTMQHLRFGGLEAGSKGDIESEYRLAVNPRIVGKRQISPDELAARLEKYWVVAARAEIGQPFTFHYVRSA